MSKFSWVSFIFLFPVLILAFLSPVSDAQLSPSETRILFQAQKLLEYPQILQNWSNWTNFCYLPPSQSIKLVCSDNHVTELNIVGNRNRDRTLSKNFSIDAFFTVLTKLSKLKSLSLVSLGLWGSIPLKISRFSSLKSLNLSSNSISGNIPASISTFKNLKTLVLAQNSLGPKFSSLGKNLTTIILTNNSFKSEIPSLKGFNNLQQFDISYNKFLGPIQSSLFSLPSIQYLNLAYNQLSGVIPINTTCNNQLKFVDISHNLLTGKLPACIGSRSVNRIVNVSWNCLGNGNSKYQHSDSFCHKGAMAVKPEVKSEKNELGKKIGLMLGVIGGIVGVCGVVLVLIFVGIRRRGIRRRDEDGKFEISLEADRKMPVHGSPPVSKIDPRRVPQRMKTATLGLSPYRELTLEDIEEATKNFDPSTLINEEGSKEEETYKGTLSDGSVVELKCIKIKQKVLGQNMKQQMIQVLRDLRHRHLVSVVGHCVLTHRHDHPNTATTFFIAFEHVSNSSLREYLTDWRKKEMLKWPQRMAITIGAARGVQFLHNGTAPGIFGNNLKIDNVLLDEALTAKISNYKIPLPFKMDSESSVNGDNVLDRYENGEKEDIYQFGVILLEVITGNLISSAGELNELKHQLERALTEGASRLRRIVDPSIQGSFAFDSLETTAQITINCLCRDSSKRPSIEDVLWNLQYSMQVQEGWTTSGNLSTLM